MYFSGKYFSLFSENVGYNICLEVKTGAFKMARESSIRRPVYTDSIERVQEESGCEPGELCVTLVQGSLVEGLL